MSKRQHARQCSNKHRREVNHKGGPVNFSLVCTSYACYLFYRFLMLYRVPICCRVNSSGTMCRPVIRDFPPVLWFSRSCSQSQTPEDFAARVMSCVGSLCVCVYVCVSVFVCLCVVVDSHNHGTLKSRCAKTHPQRQRGLRGKWY